MTQEEIYKIAPYVEEHYKRCWVEGYIAGLQAKDPTLDDIAEKYETKHTFQLYDGGGFTPEYDTTLADAFKAGAEWQEKRWENNRLMAQDKATEEECQREMDFVDNHIKKHHRIPTFSDAINYGIEWAREQMLKDAVEGEVMDFSSNQPRPQVDVLLDPYKYQTGDKVKIIIVKEDGE